jgi:adenosylmethionine-8-amino-7-oxononanoate aminotransferase
VEASATKGERLTALLQARLGDHPSVGEIRGRGLMVGLEFVRDRETRDPYPRRLRVAEGIVAAARDRGVLVYSGTGNADGTDGDIILLGPPFVVTDTELETIVAALGDAIDAALPEAVTSGL